MEVYIEYVILDNLLIDYFILSITKKICKLETKQIYVILSALFGTIVSIISPFLSGIFLILTKLLCSILMPLILLKKPKLKTFVITYLCFLLSTMIMGGACIMFCSVFNIDYVINDGSIMVYNFPVGLALLICLILYVVIKNLITHFYNIKHLSKFLYDITLTSEEKNIKCKGFLDTGNRLVDKSTNEPIILINYDLFSKLFPEIKLTDLLLKRYQNINLKNIREIEVKSIAKSSKILCFEIDNILIDGKVIKNFIVGLSHKNFNENLNADCILNPLIFEKEQI